jgi:hypothetical protein
VSPSCASPLPLDRLIAYQLGELPEDEAATVEQHYFACGRCAERLAAVVRLQQGIVALVREGRITSSVTAALVDRVTVEGLQVRSYHLAPGQQVACTAAPLDDFVVVRLALPREPSQSIDRIDLATEVTLLPSGETRQQMAEDVAIDRSSGEIVLAFSGDLVRSFPRTRWTMTARLHGAASQRSLGPYTLDHTPWEQLPPDAK